MTIKKHIHRNRIVIDLINLEENEFVLIAYLIEKNSQKAKKNNVVKESIGLKLNVEMQKFIDEEL